LGSYPKEKFEWIEEWHAENDRKYLVGTPFNELKTAIGGKKITFLIRPDSIIEDVEIRRLKKRASNCRELFERRPNRSD
jgi:homoserine dehydrogenase